MMRESECVLLVKNLRVRDRRRRLTLVGPLSFKLYAGECLAIIGESGSGKTLLLRALMNLLPEGLELTFDRFVIAGQDARTLSPRDWNSLRGNDMTLIQQDSGQALDPLSRVESEVLEATLAHNRRHARRQRMLGGRERVLSVLHRVGLAHPESLLTRRSAELSGGQRQRVLIASMLVTGPKIVLADEPTTALDASVQKVVLNTLQEQKNAHRSLIIVSHDPLVIRHLADRMVFLRNGQLVTLESITNGIDSTLAPAQQGREVSFGEAILSAHEVCAEYSSGTGIRNVSFQISAGEVVAVLGESGAGKSTLARVLSGVHRPTSGNVCVGSGVWLSAQAEPNRKNRWMIQWVPQDAMASFARGMTVGQILREALGVHDRTIAQSASSEDRVRAARTLLTDVGLESVSLSSMPKNLSGGQRQRLAIARALASKPLVLVCDEAVSALDTNARNGVLDLLRNLALSNQLAVVFISHDVSVVRQFADSVIIMLDGEVIEAGSCHSVFERPKHDFTRAMIRDSQFPLNQ